MQDAEKKLMATYIAQLRDVQKDLHKFFQIAEKLLPEVEKTKTLTRLEKEMEQMREKISQGLEARSVDVNDLSGNGRHVSIKVVSQAFEGKSSVNRQRMVYKCIWLELQDQVHAVNEMVTMTPEEATKM